MGYGTKITDALHANTYNVFLMPLVQSREEDNEAVKTRGWMKIIGVERGQVNYLYSPSVT